MNLVQVQFESRWRQGTFNGAGYTYIADHPLQVGDLVKVPTKYGEATAKVCRVDVPVEEIGCRVGELKHITEPATTGDLFSDFFN